MVVAAPEDLLPARNRGPRGTVKLITAGAALGTATMLPGPAGSRPRQR